MGIHHKNYYYGNIFANDFKALGTKLRDFFWLLCILARTNVDDLWCDKESFELPNSNENVGTAMLHSNDTYY